MSKDIFYMFGLVLKNKRIFDKKIDDKFAEKLKKVYTISEHKKNLYKIKLNKIIENSQRYDEKDLEDLLKNI